jgi:hypothetical protein
MRAIERQVAAAQLLLISPALLFMGSLVGRNLSPLQDEPANTAQQIVMWYAVRMWTVWALLIALPLGVLITGCIMFARSWSKDVRLSQAAQHTLAAIHANGSKLIVAVMTLTAGAILTIVVLHMLTN